MQSSYFPRLDLSARVSYSSGSQNLYDWVENWNGMEVKPTSRIHAPRNFHANLVTISVRYMF